MIKIRKSIWSLVLWFLILILTISLNGCKSVNDDSSATATDKETSIVNAVSKEDATLNSDTFKLNRMLNELASMDSSVLNALSKGDKEKMRLQIQLDSPSSQLLEGFEEDYRRLSKELDIAEKKLDSLKKADDRY